MKIKLKALCFALASTTGLLHQEALASKYHVNLVVSPEVSGSKLVSGIKWEAKEADIDVIPEGVNLKAVAVLEGKITNEKISLLLHKSKSITPPKNGSNFKIPVSLLGRLTPVELSAVSEEGEIETLNFVLTCEECEALFENTESTRAQTNKRFKVTTGVGAASMNYQQVGVLAFSQFAINGTAAIKYILSSSWDLAIAGNITILPMASSLGDVKLRILGLNGRIGYVFPFLSESWQLTLLGGYYYSTTYGNTDFGYQDVGGPQIYPVFRHVLKSGDELNFWGKFSPIAAGGFSFLSLTNREIEVGASWTKRLGGHRVGLTVNYSHLSFTAFDTVISSALTVGLSYVW